MRNHHVQEYKLEGRIVIPYQGNKPSLVKEYRYQQTQNEKRPRIIEIIGSLHRARKLLDGQCCWCMKQIKKGEVYVQKNAIVFADCFRSHLECDVHNDEGRYHVKKSWINQLRHREHEVIRINKSNLIEIQTTLHSIREVKP